jgi:membrane-associated phospholipid phosphatase
LGLGIATLLVGVANPKHLPAGLKTIGLMYLIRAIFITVTHLRVHADKLSLESYSGIEKALYGSNDLFFSGHTALPFITALIFWNIKPLRYAFLCASAIFGIGTLLAKSHYTIDVLAAPFMAYAIYQLARFLFRKDFTYQEKN